MPATDGARCDALPAFRTIRLITQADLAAVTERVQRCVIRWFRLNRLLDAAAAADMLAWEHSGFSIDMNAGSRSFVPDLRVKCQPLEHFLRYCARPPFALEGLSVIRGEDGRMTRVCSEKPGQNF